MRVSLDLVDGLLRPAAAKPKRPTSREQAATNRLNVLRAVSEHGHLRCADIAAACWPKAAYGEQMAQRTVRALVESGDLLVRRNAHGGKSVVCTRVGAAALEVRGIPARHGLDLASVRGPTFTHHCLTSMWTLRKRLQGFDAFHEYAVVNGQAPVSAQQLIARYGKLCDAVLVRGDRLYLCETEASPKSGQEIARIAMLATHVGRRVHPELPFVLAGIFLVFDAEQNHAARFAKVARESWARYSASDQATLAARVMLAKVSLGLPLVWRGCSEERLTLRPV